MTANPSELVIVDATGDPPLPVFPSYVHARCKHRTLVSPTILRDLLVAEKFYCAFCPTGYYAAADFAWDEADPYASGWTGQKEEALHTSGECSCPK